MRRVGEDELGAHAAIGVDGPGERVLVRVARLEAGLLARRQAEHVGVGRPRQLREGEPPVGAPVTTAAPSRSSRSAASISSRCAAMCS